MGVRFVLHALVCIALPLGNHVSALITPISKWTVASSATTGDNITHLSQPGLDTSSWYTIDSKATLMATLLQNNVYNETDLFFTTNLKQVDIDQFRVPWYYRSEGLPQQSLMKSYHYVLQTHGINSRADVWINGQLVVSKDAQAGGYNGLDLHVTKYLKLDGSPNVLLVKTYPTDYNRDLALGFVDWNPYPPDNGTGIWRDVEIKRTGPISISSPRIIVGEALNGSIEVRLEVRNLDPTASINAQMECSIVDPDGNHTTRVSSTLTLAGEQRTKISMSAKIPNPRLWWPAQWGAQPLYNITCVVGASSSDMTSDSSTSRFGIRTVSHTFDPKHNDTTFYVNSRPFQVLGAGYTSDIFLRFSEPKLRSQFLYAMDMGLNTIRLEGKQEHPALYTLADELGLMLLPGWECCDKWEGWSYNDEGSGAKWSDADYTIAQQSLRHEAALMQSHPSILGFLVGSDYWPDDRATKAYLDAFREMDWDAPVISSASQRGSPAALGNGGMTMAGPYDWVPPNYWFDAKQRLGSAGGFGSELGAGVGTPELGSLRKFLSESDLRDLWSQEAKDKGLYHMSTNVSSFYTRSIYNEGLWKRFGQPKSLDDYVLKAQMMDFEATQAQFDAYTSRWNKNLDRPATGMIYWMFNNAWPSLHWNLFDYYLHPGGSYFGAKASVGEFQSPVYDPTDRSIFLVDRRLFASPNEDGKRTLDVDVIDLHGRSIMQETVQTTTRLNSAKKVTSLSGSNSSSEVRLIRLRLYQGEKTDLARKVYWAAPQLDTLDWDNSTWYHTPVTSFSNLTSLFDTPSAELSVKTGTNSTLSLENRSKHPAIFVRLNLVDKHGGDIVPVVWSENYITLWPGEKMEVYVNYECCQEGVGVEVSGVNVEKKIVMFEGAYGKHPQQNL